MAVTVDAVTGAQSGTTTATSLSWTHTTAAGASLLLVDVGFNDNGKSVASLTYGGVALTQVPGSVASSGVTSTDRHKELWYLLSPAAGAQTIALSITTGGTTYLTGESATFLGADATTPLGTAVTAAGNSAPATMTVTSAAGELVYTGIETRVSAATAPAGATSVVQETASSNVFGASAVMDGALNVTIGWTTTGAGFYAATAVPIHAAAAAGTLTASPADAFPMTSALTSAMGAARSAVETVGITDRATATIGLTSLTNETVGLTDTVTAFIIPAPPPAVAPFPTFTRPPDPYSQAIRNGVKLAYTVDASLNGNPVVGATGMQPVGGSITDTTKPGVRRTLSLDLAPAPGLYDLLSPIGTALTVTAKVTYAGNTGVMIPMGVFNVDSESISEGGGKLSLTAPDKWSMIQRARFFSPTASTPGITAVRQIVSLIQGALGANEPVAITATSTALTPTVVWDTDRDKAIIDLATGIGAWVYFDRNGVATIADLPTTGKSADWLIDASPTGVLVSLDRQRSRTTTYNVVAVASSASDGEKFPVQYVWDSDPTSPTFAGNNDGTGRPDPTTSGPFGIVTYKFDTPLPLDVNGARATGATILARTTGLASSISLSSAPNPACDAFDVLDVLPPKQRYDIPRVVERHVVDTVSHQLDVTQPQHIDGRSTRTDPYT